MTQLTLVPNRPFPRSKVENEQQLVVTTTFDESSIEQLTKYEDEWKLQSASREGKTIVWKYARRRPV